MKRPIIPDNLRELNLDRLEAAASLKLVRVTDTRMAGLVASSVAVEQVLFDEVEISSSRLRKATVEDTVFRKCLLFGTDFDGSGWRRVELDQGIASGMAVSGSALREVGFSSIKLNLANFRASKLVDVSFVDCDLTEADFQGAELKNVRFSGCQMDSVDFSTAKMKTVDLTGNDISTIRGVASLNGAKIDVAQLISLAGVLAAEIGIEVV